MATVTKVWVETSDCTSCEMCVSACPEVFEMAGDYAAVKAEGKDPAYLAANSDGIVQAAQDCPCDAIKYETA